MRSPTLWALLPLISLASSALAVFPIANVKKASILPTVPNKFIVEVEDIANIPHKRSFKRSLDAVYFSLKERDVLFTVTKEFDSELFVGASVVLNNAKDALAIEKTPGVKAIRPVRSFKIPTAVTTHVLTGPNDPKLPPDSFSTHVLTGVDKLHAEGINGKGIKIGVIDTGIDYNHPTLGGGFGPNFLVSGGHDFVGDAYTGANTPVPDSDPLDCAGHGTHVAGIIAALPGNAFNISGVAYGASLSAYRVFGCDGSVSEDVLVEALTTGYKDGMDVLTMSIGGADGWAESSSAVVASRIAHLGKIVTIAAGNDGDKGSWYSSSPGNAFNAISVASVDNTNFPIQTINVKGVDHAPIPYFSTLPFAVQGDLPIYATSKDTTIANDACDPLPASTPDLSDKLVIIRRGSCAFTQKLGNVAAKGAKVALIYDNGNGFAAIEVGNFTATLIQAQDGAFLVEQFAAGKQVTASFPQVGGAITFPSDHGGLVSDFSTYGPSNDFHFKPAVAAPGGNIISTMLLNKGGFAVLSGTSMATPLVAGVSALLLSVKGKAPHIGKGARDLFETTATKIPSSKTDSDPLHTLTQAGAGLIQAYEAIHATTIISPGELILNDTAHFKGQQTFKVTNDGKAAKKYTLGHSPAGTALTVQPGSILAAKGPVPVSKSAAVVNINPSSFTLNPGQSITVSASFTPPTGLDPSTYPVYSGFIDVKSGSENYHVSYLGLAGSLKDKEVVDNTDQFFGFTVPAILDVSGNPQSAATNYTFVNGSNPTLLWRLAFGTPALHIDLVDPAIAFTPTLKSRTLSNLGSFFSFGHKNKGGSFAKVQTIGPLAEFDYISRHDDSQDPTTVTAYSTYNMDTPTFANGTVIPNGQYRALIRALRVTGNPLNEEDYESWLSPVFGIQKPS